MEVLSFPVMSRIEKRRVGESPRPKTAPNTPRGNPSKSQLSNYSMALRPPAHSPDVGERYPVRATPDHPLDLHRQDHARAHLGEVSTHRDDLSPEPPYPQRSSSRYYSTAESSEPPTLAEQAFVTPQGPAMTLPDPSQFPDPYPFRPPHHHLNSMPALSSSGGSTSNSTRSSAYASSGSNPISGDYNNVHIASSDEYVAITPDSVSQYLAKDPGAFPTARPTQSRAPVEHSRYSDALSSSARSRSSSIGNNSSQPHDNNTIPAVPSLAQKPSYDISWQSVDERDEAGILSEDETDDEQGILDSDTSGLVDHEEERTSAAVIADEGRGLIVQANNTPIVQLQVQTGTTHLLIGSSTTPNAIPQFLKNTLPLIATTLLALDISANFLGALPPVLSVCENLEELNVASNPLRVLPVFLADLHNLRLLIADATGISTLPDTLVDLDKLHMLSIRRNKLHSLPSWLCLLPALQTLCVDGNPFQGPWRALVEPLLAKTPMTPAYPPSTPVPMPQLSASVAEHEAGDATDVEDGSDGDPASPTPSNIANMQAADEEDHTITPERAPILGRSVSSQVVNSPPHEPPRPLQRTRTTPNRAYFDQTRTGTRPSPTDSQIPPSMARRDDLNPPADREVRKMKSAGDLRRGRSATTVHESPNGPPPLANYSSSSVSNLLTSMGPTPALPPNAKRFGSVGPATALGVSARPPINNARPQLSKSLWDDPSTSSEHHAHANPEQLRKSYASSSTTINQPSTPMSHERPGSSRGGLRDSKEKNSRWGFLKKMSMGKMKGENTSPTPSGHPHKYPSGSRPPLPPFNPEELAQTTYPRPMVASNSMPDRLSKTPQIDLRFSSIGTLDMPTLNTPPSPPQIAKKSSRDLLRGPSLKSPPKPSHPPVAGASNGLLAPPVPTPRNAKRRSFLPFEAPGTLSIPIPDTSTFISNVTATNGPGVTGADDDTQEQRGPTTSTNAPTADAEQYIRREEERAREAYMRALRSVMAYLKDMNDLAQSQQPNPMSMYGHPDDAVAPGSRSRRPTMVDREMSMMSNGSGSTDASSQLRSSESILGLRSGTSSQTLSVATTDSSSSMDERKYKDDKGKRAKIIQEIVVTERTYVKGLQELVDIYIKPASTPANLLGGVGSNKDSVVPAQERKIVFGGIDALFSFHNDSFLPALEKAAAPLFRPNFQETDPDGKQSTDVAKLVGDIFVKHAAFMKMYSSYINNFDNSVQRVKSWTSPAGSTSPGHAISPNASTAQLVGLGMSVAGVPGALDAGMPTLTTSQKKRIKSYLKRCRLNPRHTQLNLEGYLLLPVQRIPRYKLLLEELVRSTPPSPYEFIEDPLDKALAEISLLTNNMNEGKRESESRRKLVQWQARIRGKFPSPLVQPHRRLIMDGRLLLTRVVRKAVVSFEAINAQGDSSTVQVDCLAPELTPRPLVGILCNDLLVLCRDPSDGKDANSSVDLWAVLRMQTLPQPASIVHGNALRLVDNKAILYFDAPTPSDALNWYRAINLHIPASASKA